MKRYAIIELRTAIVSDFANDDGTKKTGVLFFKQSCTGKIEPNLNVFSNTTDLDEFRELYAHNQIFVFKKMNEPVSLFNCMDWDFIDKELDYEIEQFSNLQLKINN